MTDRDRLACHLHRDGNHRFKSFCPSHALYGSLPRHSHKPATPQKTDDYKTWMSAVRRKLYAPVKGSIRTTARTPTAWAKRWTVRMDGVPLPLSMGEKNCTLSALSTISSRTRLPSTARIRMLASRTIALSLIFIWMRSSWAPLHLDAPI